MCEDKEKEKFKTCLPQAGAKLKNPKKAAGSVKHFFNYNH